MRQFYCVDLGLHDGVCVYVHACVFMYPVLQILVQIGLGESRCLTKTDNLPLMCSDLKKYVRPANYEWFVVQCFKG